MRHDVFRLTSSHLPGFVSLTTTTHVSASLFVVVVTLYEALLQACPQAAVDLCIERKITLEIIDNDNIFFIKKIFAWERVCNQKSRRFFGIFGEKIEFIDRTEFLLVGQQVIGSHVCNCDW
jgi:hypothetical protein